MSKLALHFPVLTLSGGTAASFTELFSTAKDFLDIHPDCIVQFEFNGSMIVVNDHTAESAWKHHTNQYPLQNR